MTLVAVKGGSARLSHRRRKHRWQLRGAKQLSELRSAKAPVAALTAKEYSQGRRTVTPASATFGESTISSQENEAAV